MVRAAAVSFVLLSSACALPAHVLRAYYDLPAYTHGQGDWHEQMLPMRDGARLMTRWVLPDGADHAPVVLIRNPYNLLPTALKIQCSVYVRYGMGCAIQDCRGRLDSEGVWAPLENEANDGEDTLNWLQAQPWADSIAMFGSSYLAGNALAAGARLPPKVKTLVVGVFGVSLRQVTHERGLFPHELLTAWAAYMPDRGTPKNARELYKQMLQTRPHETADEKVLGQKLDFYRTWLAADSPDAPVWSSPSTKAFEAVPGQIHVPVLFIEGLDDPFLPAGLDTFARLGSREQSTLLILPMNHTSGQLGDLKSDIDTRALSTWTYVVPWLRHHLTGEPFPYETGVIKSWAHADDGPPIIRKEWPGSTRAQALFLSAQPAAAAPCAQHTLGAQAASEVLPYRYDPKRPWRSEGGARGLAYQIVDGVTPGPVKQTWECRDDVVRFLAPPVTEPTRLIGRMKLALDVRSSAPDTAFIAKLVDIDASGRALHITDAGATLHWPTAETRQPEPYAPGADRRVELDFFPTEWLLKPGHHLGLWLSSSSFPMFSLHLNTEKPWYQSDTFNLADQQLVLGQSQLSLQIAQ